MAPKILLLLATVFSLHVTRTQGCAGQANVLFLVDATAATTQSFINSMAFVYSSVSQLAIGPNGIQAAVMLIAASGASSTTCMQPNAQMFNYTSLPPLLAAINQTTIDGAFIVASATQPAPGSDTILPYCLQTAASWLLSPSSNAQSNVPNLVVVVASADLVEGSNPTALQTASQNATYGSTVSFAVYGTPISSALSVSDTLNNLVSSPSTTHTYYADDDSTLSTASGFQTNLCYDIPACAGQADVVLVLERTGAIAYWDWLDIVDFVKQVVQNLYIAPDGVHVACVTYDSKPTLQFKFTDYTNRIDLINALDISYSEGSGGANAAAAFRFLANYVFASNGDAGNRIAVRQIAIFISDGWSNQEGSLSTLDADQVHDMGIEVFSIGVGRVSDYPDFESTMMAIASGPVEDHYFNVQSTLDLQSIVSALVNRTCRVQVSLCSINMDLVFVVDASGNVGPPDVATVHRFIDAVVSKLDINHGSVRVGLLDYATSMHPVFNLGTYSTTLDVETAVSNGATYLGEDYAGLTATAFRFARDYMFTAANGSRPNAKHVIILINDGFSLDIADAIVEAAKTRAAGINIVTIGVGSLVNLDVLASFSSYPSARNVLAAPSYDVIYRAYDKVVSMICSVEDNCASSPCQNGGNCSNIINGYVCSCPLKTTGVNCQLNCSGLIDVVFIVDGSDLVSQSNFQLCLSFIRRVALGINIAAGSRIGLVVFSDTAQVIFSLTDYNNVGDVLNAVNAAYPGGSSNMAEAIRVAWQSMYLVLRPGVPSSIVLMTIGYASLSQLAISEAVAARNAGIHVIGISLASSPYLSTLDQVASIPSRENVILLGAYTQLPLIDTKLFNSLCNNVEACLSNPCQNGATCRGGFSVYKCLCASGYTGQNCERRCLNEADVAILVQLSGSVHWEDIQNITYFIQDTLLAIDLPGRFLISLMYYNDNATILFNLNNESQVNDYISKASNLPIPTGKTDLANAIRTMNAQIFNSPGARPGVPKVAIILLNILPTLELDVTANEAAIAQRMGVDIIMIAVGQRLNTGQSYVFLNSIASYPPTTHLFYVDNYGHLDGLVPYIASATCNEVSPCQNNSCQNGGTCVDKIQQFTCNCPDLFTGPLCEQKCSVTVDIVFLLDISGNIQAGEGFDLQLTVIRTIVQSLNYQFERTRVAYVTFDKSPTIQFWLGQITSLQDILVEINVNTIGKGTDLAAALDKAALVFAAAPPKATNVNRVAVLVSDGKSNVEITRTLSAASNLKDDGVTVYTVAVGPSRDDDTMQQIATNYYEPYAVIVQTTGDATNSSQLIIDSLCNL